MREGIKQLAHLSLVSASRPLRAMERAREAVGRRGWAGLAARPRRAAATGELADRPINLLIEVLTLDRGGLEEVVYELIRSLDRARFRPVVACVKGGGLVADRVRALGVPVSELGESVEAYEALLANEHIDLVNSHYSLFGAPLARWARVPNLHVLHNSYIWQGKGEVRRFARRFWDIDRFIAVSPTVAAYARSRYGVPAAKLQVIPNGIDVERLSRVEEGMREEVRAELGFAPGDYAFLHVGTYEPRKGHRALLRAFERVAAEVPSARLICTGNCSDPAYLEECRAFVGERGLDSRVRLLDQGLEIARLYAAADAFVLPSVVEGGLTVSAMEAMARRLPVILTDVGGVRDLFGDAEVGVMLDGYLPRLDLASSAEIAAVYAAPPPEIVAALAAAMRGFSDDRARARELGRRGAEFVAANCGIDVVARCYEGAFLAAVEAT